MIIQLFLLLTTLLYAQPCRRSVNQIVPNSDRKSFYEASLITRQVRENSIEEIIKNLEDHGIKLDHIKVKTAVMDIHSWGGMDIFDLDAITEGHPLLFTTYYMLKEEGYIKNLKLDSDKLLNYLQKLEAIYSKPNRQGLPVICGDPTSDMVPYHNRIHAADVTQTVAYLLDSRKLRRIFTDLEKFAVIYAAAIHDVGHPGVSATFLQNTNWPMTKNRNSPILENYHLEVAANISLLPNCDFLSSLSKDDRDTVRGIVNDMVRHTDMTYHSSLLSSLKEIANNSDVDINDKAIRYKLLNIILHLADISNPVKPLKLYKEWSRRIMKEFWSQGDEEAARGFTISKGCNRAKDDLNKVQVGFMDYVIKEVWQKWVDFNKDDKIILDNLKANREYFSDTSNCKECSQFCDRTKSKL